MGVGCHRIFKTKFIPSQNLGEILGNIVPDLNDLSYIACFDCQNYFYVVEMPMGINDPLFCPYCGIKFDIMVDGDEE